MIFIESYILNPLDVRGGENILEPITTFGGYKSNITINSDGSGTIVYNNSDYTISISNDCIIGNTSIFTLSNVSNSDTVKLYEDNQLISTTTGNSVPYTPTVAGEHEIYFKVNNISTNTINVNVYTLTSVTISGLQTISGITYFNCRNDLQINVKPNMAEDVILNNIPIVITYGSTTITRVVSNLGTTITISPLLTSSQSTNTLNINCAGNTETYTVQEYFGILRPGMMNLENISNFSAMSGIESGIQTQTNRWVLWNSTSAIECLDFNGLEFYNMYPGIYVKLVVSKSTTVTELPIFEGMRLDHVYVPLSSSSDTTIILKSIKNSSNDFDLQIISGGNTQTLSNIGPLFHIGIGPDKAISILEVLYGVL